MNYRHGFHAGNFADVFKHLILSRIIEHLKRKEKAFRVIDTHAGSGAYDLPDAGKLSAKGKPPEWVNGIGRLMNWAANPVLAPILNPYLEAVFGGDGKSMPNSYPGPPCLPAN